MNESQLQGANYFCRSQSDPRSIRQINTFVSTDLNLEQRECGQWKAGTLWEQARRLQHQCCLFPVSSQCAWELPPPWILLSCGDAGQRQVTASHTSVTELRWHDTVKCLNPLPQSFTKETMLDFQAFKLSEKPDFRQLPGQSYLSKNT